MPNGSSGPADDPSLAGLMLALRSARMEHPPPGYRSKNLEDYRKYTGTNPQAFSADYYYRHPEIPPGEMGSLATVFGEILRQLFSPEIPYGYPMDSPWNQPSQLEQQRSSLRSVHWDKFDEEPENAGALIPRWLFDESQWRGEEELFSPSWWEYVNSVDKDNMGDLPWKRREEEDR